MHLVDGSPLALAAIHPAAPGLPVPFSLIKKTSVKNNQNKQKIVLVEDILSSIKVGHTCNAVGLLYAYIPDDLILKLAEKYQEIILWLDWDKNARVIDKVKRYKAFGMPVRAIMTRKDPKMYTDELIYNKIYGGK